MRQSVKSFDLVKYLAQSQPVGQDDKFSEKGDDSDICAGKVMIDPMMLELSLALPLQALNGGLFRMRGPGIHGERVIDSHELIFVRSGTLAMWEEEKHFLVHSGQTLILHAGRRHGGLEAFTPDLSFYWLHFNLTGPPATPPTGERLAIPKHATLADPDRMVELFRRFLDDQQSGRQNTLQASLLIMLMLSEVAMGPVGESGSGGSVALANLVLQYIRTHFHEPIHTEHIAAHFKCNADYLGRVFKAVYGQSITETIHRRRLRYAMDRLISTNETIAEISLSCGFSDPGYFRRLFRRYEGMTPRAYRRLYAQVHVNTE